MNQSEFKRPSLFSAGTLYLLAGIGLWLSLLISGRLRLGLRILLPSAGEETLNLLISIGYYLPFVFCPVALWCTSHDGVQKAMRLNPIHPGDMIRASVIALLSVMVTQNASTIWMILLQKLGLNIFVNEYVRPENSTQLMLSVITAAVIAPLCEEFLFRGAMLSAWERKGPKAAVLTTAILFAILHGSVLGFPAHFFCGIMLALVVLWSDSIYAGLAFHSVYNAGLAMMDYVASAVPMDAAEEALMRSNLLAYMGGFSGMITLLLNIALDLAIIVLLARRMQVRYMLRRLFSQIPPGGSMPKTAENLRDLMKQAPDTDSTPMSVGAAIVLMSGIVTCIGLYVIDILTMLGG